MKVTDGHSGHAEALKAGDYVMAHDPDWGPGKVIEDENDGVVTVLKHNSGITYHGQPARLFRKVSDNRD